MNYVKYFNRMTRHALVFIFLAYGITGFAQNLVPTALRAQMTLDMLNSSDIGMGDLLYGIPHKPGKTIGDHFLSSHWNRATIELENSDELIQNFPVKYDLNAQVLEIQSRTGIKVLEIKRVKSMVWIDSVTNIPHYFLNGKNFIDQGVPIDGLLEIVVEGKKNLIQRFVTVTKKPDYVPALDVGSKDYVITKKSIFYTLNNKELVKISNKKVLLAQMADNSEKVESYMKEKKLGVKNQYELMAIFEYYNSL